MRVETFDTKRFEVACEDLAKQAMKKMQPELVIGIRTGGLWVMKAMRNYLENDGLKQSLPEFSKNHFHFGEISLQRPSSKNKQKIAKLLHCLPNCCTNFLRKMEARCLAWQHRRKAPPLYAPEQLQFDPNSEKLLQSRALRIWIVDDAVDSGRSMASIRAKLQTYSHKHQVLYASITVTEDKPLLMPDCYLFHKQLLIRFPWSMDYKGKAGFESELTGETRPKKAEHTASCENKKALVVDFDGSLYRGNSFEDCVKMATKHACRQGQLLAVLRICFWVGLRKIRCINHARMKYHLLPILEKHLPLPEFTDHLQLHLNEEVLEQCEAYRALGYHLCLATAAPRFYIEGLATMLKFDSCCATESAHLPYAQWKENKGEEKRDRCLQLLALAGAELELFITDHQDDAPLLAVAPHHILIQH